MVNPVIKAAKRITKILEYVPQPDGYTCQSAVIAKVIGSTKVDIIRSDLFKLGTPGDPYVMGKYLAKRVAEYRFLDDASLNDARKALNDGYSLITHGWFTGSGHVISIVGWELDKSKLSYRFICDDPWMEFDFKNWRYLPGTSGNDVRYSSYGIYAACVASSSLDSARRLYNRGELDSNKPGMWLHLIKN
jgi:hypothetical protein